ncbi:DUF86 domain-containing protein [Aquibacillus koreensis]|uniref:DUF86 domain-containing protein n=1 Tax=Aquibacillus koreensis TaxID=279446 RepID=A0A9X3WQ22_9BACI|nr:DUF86 domain-containing protein [Aquibacillus koreensis]MCT2536743.1 DUF86 domain-containing protein [Aquibacillus koreensis]MDC3421501.1 DUF86 domain-containing protein [Aquibacillus koreensis]
MQREPSVFSEDIYTAAEKIESYTDGLSFESFIDNDLVFDAVIKNILVIGEATKNIPDHIRNDNPQIEWRKIARMRDMMIHGYFSINHRIVWDVVQNKIPILKKEVKKLI